MVKIAFFNLPARGHLNPTIPIVKELVRLGAEVHYFIGDEYKEAVEQAGCTFHSLPVLRRLGDASSQTGSAPDDRQIALMPFAMANQAPQVVPQLIEEIRTLEPDCLVYNTLSLWPRLVGRILDISAVGFRPFHAPREYRLAAASSTSDRLGKLAAATDRGLSSLMSWFGKPPISVVDLVAHADDLTLMFLLRELQHEAERFDDRYLFVGPCLEARDPEPWPFDDLNNRNLRRAYVSLGTMRNDDPEFYRMCFSVFSPDSWEVVMSVGAHVSLDSLAPIPGNFLVARSVHQTAVLPHVDIFVTHGGLNSVMESLTFGVPMVMVPSIREQDLTAHRVEKLECGVTLDRHSLTTVHLERAVSAVVKDASMKPRLRLMQEKIKDAGGYKQAANAIAAFAST